MLDSLERHDGGGWSVSDEAGGVGLADAIATVRAELEQAIATRRGSALDLRAGAVEMEFQVSFSRTATGGHQGRGRHCRRQGAGRKRGHTPGAGPRPVQARRLPALLPFHVWGHSLAQTGSVRSWPPSRDGPTTQSRQESRPRWSWWSRDEPHNVWEQAILRLFDIRVGVASGVAAALTSLRTTRCHRRVSDGPTESSRAYG